MDTGVALITLRSSWCVFPWPDPSAACRSCPRSFAITETTPGPCGSPAGQFLPLVAAHQQPTGAAGHVDHVRASLLQDQIQAGAQAVPALSEGRDARVAAGDFASDGGGGKRGLEFADADCGFGEMVGR
jgi:hypothetical protein